MRCHNGVISSPLIQLIQNVAIHCISGADLRYCIISQNCRLSLHTGVFPSPIHLSQGAIAKTVTLNSKQKALATLRDSETNMSSSITNDLGVLFVGRWLIV